MMADSWGRLRLRAYEPEAGRRTPLEVRFWGVRGSIPTPGTSTQRWGGNTACLEVRHGDRSPLVFDCGTGARLLGGKLAGDPAGELDIVFSHLHMDHVFGFPFFIPVYLAGYKVRVTVPAYSADEAREKLARYLNGTYHPTRLRDLSSDIEFLPVRTGESFQRGPWELHTIGLNHPGGSVGYRVEVDGASLCYVTDTAPFAKPGTGICHGGPPTPAEQRMVDFLKGADVVIYDTMYELNEFLEKMTWGHSYPEYAVELCRAAGAKHLILFHHRPEAADDEMDAMDARWSKQHGALRVSVAREGELVSVEG